MKNKIITFASIGLFCVNSLFAQSSNTLFPASFNERVDMQTPQIHQISAVDYQDLLAKDQGAYMVAKFVASDLSFPNAGLLSKTQSGNTIWQLKVNLEDAAAVGFYFDLFALPKGVTMFAFNNNKKQVAGPFTSENNDERLGFAIEAIQGSMVYLELNIDANVNLDDIQLHIDRLASYFRGVEELSYFSDEHEHGTIDAYDEAAYSTASKCMINANCPEASNYDIARGATLKEVIPTDAGVGYCSGSLVNNTDNTTANCKRYLLTATHCEGDNRTGSHISFSQWLLMLNYQSPSCDNTAEAPIANKITGVKFLSRDPYDDEASASELDADFLLLQITGLIPSSWNANLVGWNANSTIPLAYVGTKRFPFFHHPNGDIKKFSASKVIANADVSTWATEYSEGYGAPGSSGSSMFNNDQQIIGIASTALYGGGLPDTCAYSGRNILEAGNSSKQLYYAKISYSWDNPSITSPTDAQKLKPWLAPSSEAKTLGALKSNCQPITSSIQDLSLNFKGDFNIYPNPSSNGIFQMNIRMDEPTSGNIQVVDIAGRPVFTANMAKLQSQIINLDLNHLANGVYLVKISNEYGQITKKVVINK